MNIIIYTAGDFPFGDAAANYVRLLCMGLKANKNKVRTRLLRGFWHKQEYKKTYKGIEFKPVFLKKKPKTILLKIVELVGNFIFLPFHIIYDKFKYKANIILLYGIDYPYYTMWFLIAKKCLNILIIRIVADSYNMKAVSPHKLFYFKWILYKLQKKQIDKRFSGIICLTNYLKIEFLKNGVSPNNILVIPHFINLDVSDIPPDMEILNDTSNKICYSGSLNNRNGIFYLLEAFNIIYEKNKKFKLFLIGSVDSLDKKEMDLLNLYKSKFKDSLILTGLVSYERVIGILKSCDLLINPRQECIESEAGFPTKLGEYFSVKKPIISTSTGDISKYFENKRCLILIESNNPQALAEEIISLFKNKINQKELAVNGYKWAIKNLDYIKNAKRTFEFIHNLK